MQEKIEVTRSSMPPFEEYVNEIRPLWESRMLTNGGEKHAALEAALRVFFGEEHLSLCVNGHSGLEGILDVLGLTGEVITTPFTFASTTNALVRRGLTPVFCDIRPDDYTLDPEKIEEKITPRTSAILAVHVYGNLCHTEAIEAAAKKHGLKVIYDAAHAFGVTKNGLSAAAFGDASMFSFHATKVFHTIEWGAAVFRTERQKEAFDRWKNFGLADDAAEAFGPNAKMNEFAAAMGLCNLRRIDASIASRKEAALRYRARLSGVPVVHISPEQPGVKSNYAYFPVVFTPEVFGASRDDVLAALAAEGIAGRKYFYPLTSSVQAFGGAHPETETPVAAFTSQNVLCLPLYEGLGAETADRICNVVLSLKK
jgi:dTDP-4-amino-4,6-dideoxygalactose transaminase